MQLQEIFQHLHPTLRAGVDYTFGTKEQSVTIRRGNNLPQLETETVTDYEDLDKVTWLDQGTTKPTLAECEAEWATMQIEESDANVIEQRRVAYGSVGDQLDMIWHDLEAGNAQLTTWRDFIRTIKTQYPKSGE